MGGYFPAHPKNPTIHAEIYIFRNIKLFLFRPFWGGGGWVGVYFHQTMQPSSNNNICNPFISHQHAKQEKQKLAKSLLSQ